MTKTTLRPYQLGDKPSADTVPVSVVVLTKDEEVNIERCLISVAWAKQVIVIDSGSTDATVAIARALGADVVVQPWLGFSGQREFALRLPQLLHDWVYFVDADEWISPELGKEIQDVLAAPTCAGFTHRLRLIFMGTWIRHCGWYRGSWVVRLIDRRYAKFDGSLFGERACIEGTIGRLQNDIVDEDQKGLARWLHKHVWYAELTVQGKEKPGNLGRSIRSLRQRTDSRPQARAILKDVIFPFVPAKPIALFIFMYIIRLGMLDGVAGLRFCFYHAWFQLTVNALEAETSASEQNNV